MSKARRLVSPCRWMLPLLLGVLVGRGNAQPASDIPRFTPLIRSSEDFEVAQRQVLEAVRSAPQPEIAFPPDDTGIGRVSRTERGGEDGPIPRMASPADLAVNLPDSVVEACRQIASKQLNKTVSGPEGVSHILHTDQPSPEAAVVLDWIRRPALLVCDDVIESRPGHRWEVSLAQRKVILQRILQSTGAISANFGGADIQIGTGWLIAPGIAATNRHVALHFAERTFGSTSWTLAGVPGTTAQARATIDFGKFSPGCPAGDRLFEITGILYIEEQAAPDLALLKIQSTNGDGLALPPPLPLASDEEKEQYRNQLAGRPVFVAGYPQRSNFFNTEAEQLIYQDIFDVKRISVGYLLPGSSLDGNFQHDCQTLGGSSGSPLCDFESGKVIGIHHAGEFRVSNFAAPLWSCLERPGVQDVIANGGAPATPDPAAGDIVTPTAPQGVESLAPGATEAGPTQPGGEPVSTNYPATESTAPGIPQQGGGGAAVAPSPAVNSTAPGSESSAETPEAASSEVAGSEAVESQAPSESAIGRSQLEDAGEAVIAQPESVASSLMMIPFDENGFMTDRPGFERSINQPGLQPPTDIFIMSHGWNNSPSEALASYRRMIELVNTVANIDGSRPEGYRPMLLGVRWPSKAWVDEAANEATISGLQPLESGPGSPAGRSIDPRIVAMLYENMPRGKVPDAEYSRDILELQDLIVLPEPTAADFRRAFAIYRRYAIEGEFPEDQSPFDNDEGMETALGRSVEDGRLRAPVAEGGLSIADTARVFTYWQMKGRAGLVGRNGLRLMIARLQTRFPEARIHLFGHSFGAKVLLAAVGERDMALPRPVETLVLLQGAVSLEALSDRVSGTNPRVPGGYRSALASSRVRGRIIVTFSRNDTPLNDFYPLASRLANQTGELEAAGVSRFAALGAVGAFGSAPGGGPLSDLEAMKRRGQPYERMLSRKVLSVDGGASPDFISGHSEIFNEHVAWLLWSAVKTTF